MRKKLNKITSLLLSRHFWVCSSMLIGIGRLNRFTTKAILVRLKHVTKWKYCDFFQCDTGKGMNIFVLYLERIRIMGFYDLRKMEYFSVNIQREYLNL